MHAFGGFGRREEDIALDAGDGVIGDEKAETIAMDREAAGKVFGIVTDGNEVAGSEFDEVAFVAEPIEGFFEGLAVFAVQAELANELFVSGPGVRKMANVIDEARVVE
jgi:hypothetical protein